MHASSKRYLFSVAMFFLIWRYVLVCFSISLLIGTISFEKKSFSICYNIFRVEGTSMLDGSCVEPSWSPLDAFFYGCANIVNYRYYLPLGMFPGL